MSRKYQEYIKTPTESLTITPSTSAQTIDVTEKATANVSAMPTGSIATTEGSIEGTTYTQGKVTVDTAGYISAGDKVNGSTFANTATAETTYKDISDTTAAPVLISGDYLYINKGYTDDVKISLAKLAPDEASADLASDKILQGYSAYNNDGQLIAGNIPSKSASDLTASGATVTVPSGYYSVQATKDVATGTLGTVTAVKGTVSNNSISLTPQVAAGTAGYNAMVAYSGDTVSVSASELVSGTTNITTMNSTDVTNSQYAQVVDSDLVASNIKSGVDILGVTGTASTIDTVSSVPSTKSTDIIYNNTDSSYYVWTKNFNITTSLTNVTADASNPTKIDEDGTAILTFTADYLCTLPSSVTVTGATYNWNQSTGILTLSNPTNDVSVTIIGTTTANSYIYSYADNVVGAYVYNSATSVKVYANDTYVGEVTL